MTLSTPVLFGAAYSVYVRIVMMALQTKGVAYHHVPVDVFAASGLPDWYEAIHPFGKIPAFRHEEMTLYEATVISRYVDEAFPGPPLQPETPAERAIMAQIIAITDAYGYRPLVWDIYVEKISKPRNGEATNARRVAAAFPKARTYLGAISSLIKPQPYLLGKVPTLADFHLAPVIGYFALVQEGEVMLAQYPTILTWWEFFSASPYWKALPPLK